MNIKTLEANQVKAQILVVDDMIDNVKLLSDILSSEGYKVRKALSGEMALMGAKASPVDIILLDINMPEMNGYEVCQQLKSDVKTRDIPVIFLSALSEALDKVQAFKVGGIDYICKPFQIEEVLARVENHLTIKNLQKNLTEKNTQLNNLVLVEQENRQKLELTLKELQQTQVQLVQAEKMSSLVRLVAGISHELNNPLNFICGNLNYLESYITDLYQLIKLYQNIPPELSREIQQYQNSIDFEFMMEDLTKILASMKLGTERINSVVKGLRSFSRLDESLIKSVDIHEGIECTLSFLQHQIEGEQKYRAIQVVKNYAQLPAVSCYVAELNQVFMNILSNAIAALRQEQHQEPIITINTTVKEDEMVEIVITDNGIGMTEDLRSHIFDPFFTTQPVGNGLGLGLAISYSIIVEKHGGQLTCVSSPQNGTSFIIEIPIDLAQE